MGRATLLSDTVMLFKLGGRSIITVNDSMDLCAPSL